MLELRKVSKVYGQGASEVQALHEIDLWVDSGRYDLKLWITHSPADAAYLPR
jgi:hypothetical protein